MKKTLIKLACLFILIPLSAHAQSPLPPSTQQILVVTTPEWNSVFGSLTVFEKKENGFVATLSKIPVSVGKNGLGWGIGLHPSMPEGPSKAEGDGRAPAGVFPVLSLMGDSPAAPAGTTMDYVEAKADTLCVDDAASTHYNTIVNATGLVQDWKSMERMRRKDNLYHYLALIGHNPAPAQPGKGSCIFMHIGRTPLAGTVGCTSMSEKDLVTVFGQLKKELSPQLVQMPLSVYKQVQQTWGLPEL